MPLPKRLAKFNRVVTNRVLGPFARYLPGFGIVSHVGRRSGRTYRTPVNLYKRGDGYVIALMYGADSQWVRNVSRRRRRGRVPAAAAIASSVPRWCATRRGPSCPSPCASPYDW